MSYWNYRIVKKDNAYSIREVHYREDNKIYGISDSESFFKSVLTDIYCSILNFISAIKKPILKYEEIEFVNYEFSWSTFIKERTDLEKIQEDLDELMRVCEGVLSEIPEKELKNKKYEYYKMNKLNEFMNYLKEEYNKI